MSTAAVPTLYSSTQSPFAPFPSLPGLRAHCSSLMRTCPKSEWAKSTGTRAQGRIGANYGDPGRSASFFD
jgi:hypothetical protein